MVYNADSSSLVSNNPSILASMARPVCLVTTELRTGGAEQCLARLATGLDRQRFSPSVVSLFPRPRAAPLIDRLEEAGVEVEFLGVRRAYHMPGAIGRLRRRLRDLPPPAVVQSFLFHANLAALWAAGRQTPVVTGVRVADPRRRRHWIEKKLSRRAAAVVCVSHSVAEFCRRQGYDAGQLHVIHNGIARGSLPVEPRLPSELAGRRMLLFVGRLHRQKGLDWLLRCAVSMFRRLPHHLVFAGDGPQRAHLRHLAAALGIQSRTHFLGHRDDALQLIAACDALLLPSRWEGMPNVVMEAMASGKPVVATRAEGVLELMGDDLAELQTVAFGDDAGWLQRTQEAVGPAGQQWGQANRRRISEHFSLTSMIDQYAGLYEQVLEEHRG